VEQVDGRLGGGQGDDLLLLSITLSFIQNHLSYASQRRLFVIGDEDQVRKFDAGGAVFSVRCPRHLTDVVTH
jgi:hypothetical protein